MLSEVRDFIENNINLIEEDDWTTVYHWLEERQPFLIPYFTESILKANINPLNYLDCVPARYLLGRDSVEGEFNIPSNVKSIREEAFSTCYYLTSIIIPNSVSSIGRDAFSFCHKLTNMVIPDSVTTIGEHLFQGCGTLEEVVLSNNIEILPFFGLAHCPKLKKVVLGSKLREIESHVFTNCFELEIINYNGTKELWKLIEKDKLWKDFSVVNLVLCINGTVDI